MKLKLEDPRLFANIIGIISDLVTEVRLKISKEGVNLVAVDPASVAMVYFNIPADLFSTFEAEKEEVLGINLDNLKNVLRRCGLGSKLVLEKGDEENILKLSIQDKIKRDFSLALIDVEGEEREMPQWEFDSVVKMDSDAFVDVIEDCKVVSDACTFIAEPNKFVVEAKGLNSARAEFSSDEVEIHSGNSIARFSLEYLSKFVKGAKVSNKAVLNFSDNHPMRINFPTGNVMLSFILAPRVEQDD
ncbi:proliferating cell nuclear antigen (pcna) [Candidatus Pacearchaeota archaeon CG10_big_fil_rev_8_21_14_0_10_35_219]|nr:proliferating cell nuclear antigen (pcna) [Candidatus Pacearchaeota archaeon]OIO42364.1 MAG: proliferating cell nuclear antigen (pcna) [Candidatus Pacearchaeota archaeon CG1_02_35_32]PIO07399.1 MAG: proliferating cell nuclear antigen (pcna) [Candidatus Pacearchaeota archaeon CG10_big_fil_rev_8_21_14_0_10_35_219]PJA69601.1 MAG: proliferating cell nuclear antigen (pcna) [Candidatus Pacearchaeota archaeon CG_4_9_14_3_um_filter_35_19]